MTELRIRLTAQGGATFAATMEMVDGAGEHLPVYLGRFEVDRPEDEPLSSDEIVGAFKRYAEENWRKAKPDPIADDWANVRFLVA